MRLLRDEKREAVRKNIPSLMLVENNQLLLTLVSNLLKSYPVKFLKGDLTFQGAIKSFPLLDPDVVILDLDLGSGPNGYDLAVKMRALKPTLAIVFYSSYNDERFIVGNISRKLTNYIYLRKEEILEPNTFYDAILKSLDSVSGGKQSTSKTEYHQPIKLNQSEIDLMKAIASGYSNKKIAGLRSIEIKSCENAISRLAKKLSLNQDSETNQRILISRAYFDYCGKEIS